MAAKTPQAKITSESLSKMNKPKQGIRAFDASAVELKHIKNLMCLHGSDKSGLSMRADAFEKVLDESGYDVYRFHNASVARSFLSTGGLFSDDVHLIIDDASDMLKSSKESKDLLTDVMSYLPEYPEPSHIIICVPHELPNTKSVLAFLDTFRSLGGMLRNVALPKRSQMDEWLSNYAISNGYDFPPAIIKMLLEISDGDANHAADIIDAVGEELFDIDEKELSDWVSTKTQASYSDIQNAIISRNLKDLELIGASYEGEQGKRVLLVKMCSIAYDLMLASSDRSNKMDRYVSFKKTRFPKYNAYWALSLRKKLDATGGYERYSRMYVKFRSAYAESIGFNKGLPFSIKKMFVSAVL